VKLELFTKPGVNIMKSISELFLSTLGVEEMFNVRGGDGEGTTPVKDTSTAKGKDEDIIL